MMNQLFYFIFSPTGSTGSDPPNIMAIAGAVAGVVIVLALLGLILTLLLYIGKKKGHFSGRSKC